MAEFEGDNQRPWWVGLIVFLILLGILYLIIRFFIFGRGRNPASQIPTETPAPFLTETPTPTPTALPTFALPSLTESPQTGPKD